MMMKVPLLIALACLLMAWAVGEEQNDPSQRPAKDLAGMLDRAYEKITSAQWQGRRKEAFQRKVVSDWSETEMDAVFEFWERRRQDDQSYLYWRLAFAERSAFIDEDPLCEWLLGLNDLLEEPEKNPHRGYDRHAVASERRYHFEYLEALIKRWSRRDPKVAWHAISQPDGKLIKSWLLKNYGYLLPRSNFEHLARADPKYARSEFFKHPDLLYRGSMLKGMARGLPKGYDWRGFYQALLKTTTSGQWDLIIPMRGSLLARWMEVDVVAAVNWFRSDAARILSLETVEEFSDDLEDFVEVTRPVSLRFAIRHWLVNDWKGATQWLREHPKYVEEILEDGSWVDPDGLTKVELRKIIFTVKTVAERENLLLKLAKERKLQRVLSVESSDILDEAAWAAVKKEIAELQVSKEVTRKLLEGQKNDPDQ